MISIDVNFRELEAKVEEVRKIKTRLAGAAVAAGVEAARHETPRDTGFLAASWGVWADGRSYTTPPSEGEKKDLDEARTWRYLEALRFDAQTNPDGEDGAFRGYFDAEIADLAGVRSMFLGQNRNMPRIVELRNTASYAEVLNDVPYIRNRTSENEHQGWAERARVAYERGVRAKLAQQGVG